MEKKQNQPKSSVDATNNGYLVEVSNCCKACKAPFTKSSILKHVSHSDECKSSYSQKEIQSFSNLKRERRNKSRKKLYNKTERHERHLRNKTTVMKKYHEKVGRYIEKPSDRRSLKGQAFVKIFDEAFDDPCNEFFLTNIRTEADDIVSKDEHYNDISDKTLDSIFSQELWRKSITHFTREVCQNFSYEKFHKPCLFHCPDSALADLIEFSMTSSFDKTLEENIIKISKGLARKAWSHPDINLQKIRLQKDQIYKKVFAEFYHDDSYLSIYNKAFDDCLDDVMNSHHVWCDSETSLEMLKLSYSFILSRHFVGRQC